MVACSELAVFCTAGVSDCSRPPRYVGETSSVACFSHGSATVIVGATAGSEGTIAAANCCVGGNEASSAVSAALVAFSSGGSRWIVCARSCWRDANAAMVVLKTVTRLAS